MSWRADENALIANRADDLGARLESLAADIAYECDNPREVMVLIDELSGLVKLLLERVLRDPRHALDPETGNVSDSGGR